MILSRFAVAAGAAALFALSTAASAQDSEVPASKWGPNDEIGAANLLTPKLVLEAAKLIKTGKVYKLGIPVDRSTPAFPPRSLGVTILMPNQQQGATFGTNGMSYVDDMFNGWLGIGTQIDSLAHLGISGTFYNQNKAKDFVAVTGVKKLGIAKIPPIVTRGVLFDAAKFKGKASLVEGDVITADDIRQMQEKSGIKIREGDVVVFHTGWLDMLGKDSKRYAAGEPGIDAKAAAYLATLNPVAVGADTWGVESVPFKTKRIWEGHQILLAKNGIYILETLDTREMIKDGVTEFFFVLGQPLYKGAVQAIINPIAIR